MQIGLAVSSVLCVAELIGGWWTNSLALLTDAAHMLTDVAALALALFALWVSARPASDSKTFGYARAEILAALVNGAVLCVLVVLLVWEAWTRLHAPQPVRAGGMLVIAAAGLVVNVFVALRLRGIRRTAELRAPTCTSRRTCSDRSAPSWPGGHPRDRGMRSTPGAC